MNTSTTFMNLMRSVFRKHLYRIILVFLDNILIYSRSRKEHNQHLQLVVKMLRENKLYNKLFKWEFYVPYMKFMERILSTKRVVIDPKKNKAIIDWSTSQNVGDVCSFMRLAWYYREFTKNFSRIDLLITSIQGKWKKFIWSKDYDKAFEVLKKTLSIAPILKISNPFGHLIVCIDSSLEGLGEVAR